MTCCVCQNPSFDDAPKDALCLQCLLALGELRASSLKGIDGSYDEMEERIFSELISELAKLEPKLAGKVLGIIRDLDSLDTKDAAARLNPGEANLALSVVLNVIHGTGAAV